MRSVSVQNFDGTTVTLEKPCERIVSLVPSETETLYELGAGDRVVGITDFCVRPWSFYKTKVRVGGTKTPNFTRISWLAPDLILCNREENTERAVARLRDVAPVHVSYPTDIEGAKEVVLALGRLTDCEARALEINSEIDESLHRAETSFPILGGKSVLYLIWKSPYFTISPDTYIYDVLTKAHLIPILFRSEGRYPKLTDEDVEGCGAEVVMFPDEPYNFTYSDIEEFRQRFPDLPAVRNDCLFKIEGANVCWFGYRTSLALDYLIYCLNLP